MLWEGSILNYLSYGKDLLTLHWPLLSCNTGHCQNDTSQQKPRLLQIKLMLRKSLTYITIFVFLQDQYKRSHWMSLCMPVLHFSFQNTTFSSFSCGFFSSFFFFSPHNHYVTRFSLAGKVNQGYSNISDFTSAF